MFFLLFFLCFFLLFLRKNLRIFSIVFYIVSRKKNNCFLFIFYRENYEVFILLLRNFGITILIIAQHHWHEEEELSLVLRLLGRCDDHCLLWAGEVQDDVL